MKILGPTLVLFLWRFQVKFCWLYEVIDGIIMCSRKLWDFKNYNINCSLFCLDKIPLGLVEMHTKLEDMQLSSSSLANWKGILSKTSLEFFLIWPNTLKVLKILLTSLTFVICETKFWKILKYPFSHFAK